jgi:hypothetical protein
MYDVVRIETKGDSTYFICVNDKDEERLFAGLDADVRRNVGALGEQVLLDSFREVFQNSFQQQIPLLYGLPLVQLSADRSFLEPASVDLEVPYPPPRSTASC